MVTCHFWAKIAAANDFFFSKKPLIEIPCTSWPFHCAIFKKKFLEQIQSYEDALFLGLKWPV